MNYVTETAEERAKRLEHENDQLTHQVNLLERKLSVSVQENGALHAEMEQLAQRMQSLHLSAAESDSLRVDVESLQRTNKELVAKVCAHSDECSDFETCMGRVQVYLADD